MYKKIYLAVVVMLICISSAFADSHQERFEVFSNSIEEVANKITWSGKHNFQDVEFVENEMDRDETVYSRAWYDDYYLVIRNYKDKNWSSSYVANFWTASEELTFANGIKVGSSIDDIRKFFGKDHVQQNSSSEIIVEWEENSDAGVYVVFSTENNRITSIGYVRGWYSTSKMRSLYSMYSEEVFAEIKGEKVNVREDFPKGKVLFQVSQSKRDCLLVDFDYGNGWCHVFGRIVNNSFKPVRECYIYKQFLKTRKLTLSERKLFISQYLKK